MRPFRSYLSVVSMVLPCAVSWAACGPKAGEGGSQIGSGGGTGTNGGASGRGAFGGGVGEGGELVLGVGGGTPRGDAGPTLPDGGCAFSTEKADVVPANVLFVIDRSGSMNCCPPPETPSATCENAPVKGDCLFSKWEITRDAIVNALGQLDLPNLSVGLSVFPEDNFCKVDETPDIPVRPLDPTHLASLVSFLQNNVVPGGKTPVAGATILAYKYLSDRLRSGELQGNSFVVLVSDGAETCSEPYVRQLLNEDVPNARQFRIQTFVIGVPGSEPAAPMLSELAFSGGTARSPTCSRDATGAELCHFDMSTATGDFGTELRTALDAISSSKALSCEFDVPTSGMRVDYEKVNVRFTPSGAAAEDVLQDATSGCEDGAEGWQYSTDRTKVRLCGTICNRVSTDRQGEVQIVLGCPTKKNQ